MLGQLTSILDLISQAKDFIGQNAETAEQVLAQVAKVSSTIADASAKAADWIKQFETNNQGQPIQMAEPPAEVVAVRSRLESLQDDLDTCKSKFRKVARGGPHPDGIRCDGQNCCALCDLLSSIAAELMNVLDEFVPAKT